MVNTHDKLSKDLFDAGVLMRRAQKDYFRLRTSDRLYAAKDAEYAFDRALRAYANSGDPTHPTLL